MRASRAGATLAATIAVALAGCGGDEEQGAGSGAAGGFPASYALPGDRAYPEGIAVQKSTGDYFVGSTTDGSISRGNVRKAEAEPFLPGGRDGRTAVTGMKVDRQDRLWVAGRFTGRVFVYDIATKKLVKRLQAPAGGRSFSPRREQSLINDMTVTEDAIYITDSFKPVVYRVANRGGEVGELEPWLDLTGTPAAYERGFNLNGISASDDGRYLLSAKTDSGELFRIDTQTKEVTEVDLGGEVVKTADGLLLDGRTLLVIREKPGAVVPIKLSADLSEGRVGRAFGGDKLRFPTTLAERDGRALVVNSQFDRGGNPAEASRGGERSPELPFTVSGLPLPAGTLGE